MLTTDRSVASYYPEKYNFITEDSLQKLRNEKKIVYEGDEKSFFGQDIAVYLSIDDLTKTLSSSSSSSSSSAVATADVVLVESAVDVSPLVTNNAPKKEQEQGNGLFSFFSKDGKDGSSKGKGKGKGALIPIALPCVLDGPPEMLEALLK